MSSVRSGGSVTFRVVKRSGSVWSGAAFGAVAAGSEIGLRVVRQSLEQSSVRSDDRWAFQDGRVKGEMNRLTSSSEVGPQGGKAQWQRSEQSSVQSGGRRLFQDWCDKCEMNRPTSSSEI